MVTLDSDVAMIWWTLNSLEDLKEAQKNHGFKGDQVWREQRLESPIGMRDGVISIDTPEEGWGQETLVFEQNQEELYVSAGVYADGSSWNYTALRADTSKNILLTGTFHDADGDGVFIVSFPNRLRSS